MDRYKEMTEIMENTGTILLLAAVLAGTVLIRLLMQRTGKAAGSYSSLSVQTEEEDMLPDMGVSQTTGTCGLQSDCVQAVRTRAGVMAVMADGIGRANTGKVSAQIAVDTVLDRYEPYQVLNHPEYFFRTAFQEANLRIQKTIGERRGGASLGAVYLSGAAASYALAGDIRIALLRGEELIPVSQGHTVDVLAAASYREGKLSRREALWSQEEKRVWNYLGMDGFRQVEMGELPIRLKTGDVVLMASRGIWQEVPSGDLEDLLLAGGSLQEKAERIVRAAEEAGSPQRENGSILLVRAEVTDETEQF
ncbi:MAG: protein serine/threonine phosphatase 2C family protein [Lachnospiraceae bacterium]|nr:protein serine/threonine phosphatase 2C family protein [Lachnospiraceae bacterium]